MGGGGGGGGGGVCMNKSDWSICQLTIYSYGHAVFSVRSLVSTSGLGRLLPFDGEVAPGNW